MYVQRDRAATLGIYLVVVGGVLLILFSTLYPFQFDHFSRLPHLHRYFDGVSFRGYSRCCRELAILEPLANVLLFIPFGFGLTGLIGKRGSTWMAAAGVVLLFCFGLSLAVEVLQVFQPSRTSSLADVLMNSLGGCVGFLGYQMWNRALMHSTSRRSADMSP